jgi:hypothetical protein
LYRDPKKNEKNSHHFCGKAACTRAVAAQPQQKNNLLCAYFDTIFITKYEKIACHISGPGLPQFF